MEFDLTAHLKFSDNLPQEADVELQKAIDDANNVLFIKGVPRSSVKEAGRIIEWHTHANELYVRIVSGRYTRAHEALLRFRKALGMTIGAKYRIGIRGYEINEFTIKMEAETPVQVRLPFVKQVSYDEKLLTLQLAVSEQDVEKKIPDRIVNLVEEKIKQRLYGTKLENWELVWESPQKKVHFRRDPTEELNGRRWIKHGVSRGQWIFGPQVTKVFSTFQRIIEKEILERLCYSEMIFPKMVPWDVWKRSGHARGVYPEIYYVSSPKTRDPEYWEEVTDYYKVTNEIPLELIRQKIDDPLGGMCYAQCPSFWPFMQGETISSQSLPVKVFDRSGTSHRYESGGIHGIERVDEFHRIEIVWVGDPDQVNKEAQELEKRYAHIFNDILDLEWRIARVTPWFMAQEGLIDTSSDRSVGTVDYEAYLPYRGERTESEWLEFQNVSVNGDKYPRGFNVKTQKGELWSGCSGIGLERWAAAFFAQKGLDIEFWPPKFAKLIAKLPEGIKFL
ncbi:MAG: serine--tRNA ligase [Halobacteriota archaeon]